MEGRRTERELQQMDTIIKGEAWLKIMVKSQDRCCLTGALLFVLYFVASIC